MREPFCDHGGERGTGRSGPREEAARDSRHRRPGARHSARQPRPPCGSHGACWPRRPVAGACPKATAQGRQPGLGQREGGLGDRPPWPRCGRRQDEARVDAAEPRPSGAARAGRVSRFQRHSLRPQQPLCLLITWLAPHSAGLASFRAQDTPSAGRRAEAGPVGTPGSLGLGGGHLKVLRAASWKVCALGTREGLGAGRRTGLTGWPPRHRPRVSASIFCSPWKLSGSWSCATPCRMATSGPPPYRSCR